MDFFDEETAMMLRKVLARKVCVATRGTKQESFQDVVNVLNDDKYSTVRGGGKSVRDRYENMQRLF